MKVGALVDSVAPGLCPDWEDWDPNEPIRSVSSAQWAPRVNTDLVSPQCTVGKFGKANGPVLSVISCGRQGADTGPGRLLKLLPL